MHLLITANIGGDLAYMPRLFTVMKHLKQSLATKVFLIDAGRACSEESWVCVATENRAPFIVMDGMAYNIAFADGLTPQRRDFLQEQMFTRLIFETGEVTYEDITLTIQRKFDLTEPVLENHLLKLPLPPKGIIQHLEINQNSIHQNELIEVPLTILPDPTITATVEFVMGEARYYLKKQEG